MRLQRASRFAGRTLICTLLMLAAVGVLAHVLPTQSPTLSSEVALRSASCARSLSRGGGLTTGVAYPLMLGLGIDAERQPLVTGGPFFPALLAWYFSLRGDTDLSVRLCSALGFLVCIGAGIALGARLGGFGAGALTGAALMLNPLLVGAALSGGPIAWALAWFTVAACLLTGQPERTDGAPSPGGSAGPWQWARIALAGVALGLAYLSEPSTLPLLLPAYLLMVRAASPTPVAPGAGWALLAGFALCAVPWWVRNVAVAHSPFLSLDRYALLADAPGYPENTVLRSPVSPGSPYLFVLAHPAYFLKRIGTNLASGTSAATGLTGLLTLALATAAFLVRPQSQAERALRGALVAGLLAVAAWTCLAPFTMTGPLLVVPMATALAAVLAIRLVGGLRRPARVASWAVIAVLGVSPVAVGMLEQGAPGPSAVAAAAVEASQLLPADVVVVTDEPATVAWYSQRSAMLLPLGQRGLDAARAALADRPVAYFLTRGVVTPRPREDLAPYQAMLAPERPVSDLSEVKLKSASARLFVYGPPPAPPEAASAEPGAAPKGGEGTR